MTLPRDLGDGLTLRRGRLADADALAEFIADVLRQQDAPEPNHGLGGWTRDLMTGRHPWFRPEDDALIVEDAQGRIVSAGMLITQTLSFAGTIIQAGQPELIGTSNRLSGTGPREDAVRDVPPMERRTRPRDAVHRRHSVVLPAVRLRDGDPAWRWSGDRGRSTPGCAAGRRVSHAALRHGRCGLHRAARSGGVSAISHLRSARRGVVAIRNRGPQRCECPATDVADRRALGRAPGRGREPRARTRRVRAGGDDVRGRSRCPVAPGLDRGRPRAARGVRQASWRVAPVLERRLAASPMAGWSGELRLGFYREGGVALGIRDGAFERASLWRTSLDVVGQEMGRPSQDRGRADALLPGLTFQQLLFGSRMLDDLEFAFPDCIVRTGEARALLSAFFPR